MYNITRLPKYIRRKRPLGRYTAAKSYVLAETGTESSNLVLAKNIRLYTYYLLL